jgi:hypothetical protein
MGISPMALLTQIRLAFVIAFDRPRADAAGAGASFGPVFGSVSMVLLRARGYTA